MPVVTSVTCTVEELNMSYIHPSPCHHDPAPTCPCRPL